MPDPLAVIIRFTGDPDDLMARFEQVRASWIAEQPDDYEAPLFYALSKTNDGIAVVNVWESANAHRAFGQGLHPQLEASGLGRPDRIERMPIKKLGWD